MTRGLELKIPQYPKHMLVAADTITWEALYDDGHIDREDMGVTYDRIDRQHLKSFRLHGGGETLIETFPPAGATGWNLCYRRRSDLAAGVGRRVIFVIGWVPMGPAIAVYPDIGQYAVSDTGFKYDPMHDPNGDFQPPSPQPGSGERFDFGYLKKHLPDYHWSLAP